MEFILPAKFNGKAFKMECEAEGITLSAQPMVSDQTLILEYKNANKEKIQALLDAHIGDESPLLVEKINAKNSAILKLQALGLTEAEVKAFLG